MLGLPRRLAVGLRAGLDFGSALTVSLKIPAARNPAASCLAAVGSGRRWDSNPKPKVLICYFELCTTSGEPQEFHLLCCKPPGHDGHLFNMLRMMPLLPSPFSTSHLMRVFGYEDWDEHQTTSRCCWPITTLDRDRESGGP